jgi:TIR domain-containing protein
MPRICISYRRSDSTAIVGRIYDRLVGRYGAESVFMDLNDIPYGADFRKHIQAAFQETSVLIAAIGPAWIGQQANGAAGIHDKLDPVRVEIQTALRQRILVIPVLVDGGRMPSADDLPRNIKEFSFRNAMRVDSGVDFPLHMERLMTFVDQALGIEKTGKPAADFTASPDARPNSPYNAGANSPIGPARAKAWPSRLLPYFVAPIILSLLAHYLIIMKLDLDPIFLRLAAIAIPIPVGFLLFRGLRLGIGPAILLGLAASLAAVAGMLTFVGLVDAHPILPASTREWQEVVEYVAGMTLATGAGNLLARAMYAKVPAGRF